LECQVLDERQIADRGMGGLYAVGQGSNNPPRMIALKYQGREQPADVLGLVGKGITFDTGGISLKKADGMEEMVGDMGGAAVVLAVLYAVASLQLPVNIVAVIPSAENMPSGSALKPGDIITTYSGKTVEVLNTDAEGRLVLADGMTYAKELGADRLIDVATLTGAVLVALGDVTTGAITNDETFLKQLQEASSRVGEKLWQLPSYPEYREMLKSEVADVKNSTSPDRWAGCITGGLFVGAFAGDTPWIHLDIGGTAWLWQEKSLDPKGGSGAMVRSIVELVRQMAGK
jgi:leucyl aminopeptidase